MTDVQLIVIAKSPVAGRVKTRLSPPYTLEHAARIAEASLADTLEVVANTPALARTLVLEGEPDWWLPEGVDVLPQRGSGLDERLAAAFVDVESALRAPMLLIGMDTPQVSSDLLASASRRLVSEGFGAVLGPATDGGWWALGLHSADPAALLGVQMSTSTTCADQRARLQSRGLAVGEVATLTDVDDHPSAQRVARLVPRSRFAQSLELAAIVS